MKAVVFGTTGEFSVIKGELKDELMKDVRGYESRQSDRPYRLAPERHAV